MIPSRYQKKDSWPHVFAKSNDFRGIKEGVVFKQFCFHCHKEWWPNHPERPTNRPIERCPARTDKSEYSRLGVDF